MSTDRRHHVDLPPPRAEEVAEGIFAYVQPDGSWGLNNAGFLAGRRDVTLVDTCFTEARTKALLAAVESTVAKPVRTVVNTHHHGDHTFGNGLVATATIVGHELCRTEMVESGLSATAFFPTVDFGDVTIEPPTVTFAERLQVWVDELLVELFYVGPAHTTNDVVAWVPEHRLLFTGDVVFHQCTPFILMGSLAGSQRAIERLRTLEPEVVVPGHGPPGGPQAFDDVAAYLSFVERLARDAFAASESPLDAARQADLGGFADWPDQERLAGNIHRAFAELRGEPEGAPIDMGAATGDMVTYNGGQLPRCLA